MFVLFGFRQSLAAGYAHDVVKNSFTDLAASDRA
jgi:hypothetical protein